MLSSTSAHHRLGIIAALASTILSSVAWLTQAEAVRALSPIVFLAFGPLVAGALIGSYLALTGKLPTRAQIYQHRKDLLTLLAVRYLVAATLYAYALELTACSKVIFLTKVEPYMVIFWYWILHKQRVERYHLFLLAVHIAGAIVLSTGGKLHFDIDQLGDLMILVAVALSSLSYLPAQRLSRSLGSSSATFLLQSISGLIFLPAVLWQDSRTVNFEESHVLYGWGMLVLTVVLFHVFSSIFWYYSLQKTQAWLISALRCIGPIVAMPIAWLVLKQPLTPLQLVGAAVVLLTSWLMVKERR
jgi:drug/metabolite transporter (DMT)-like permease